MPEAGGPEPPALTLWRAYVPRWAHLPLSGAGAARFGGRWNAAGECALYAALELSTAWAEYNQGFVQHPATIARLELRTARLADLADPAECSRLNIDPSIHACDWRADLDAGRTPATHLLARRLRRSGFHGVIFPSFMSRGGRCVCLWRWNATGAPALTVIDPENRLPKTPASWL